MPEYVGRLEQEISTGRGFDGVVVAKHELKFTSTTTFVTKNTYVY
jgi:hypothetical protein